MLLAEAYHLRSIAFPAISTRVYGYPVQEAAGVALAAVFAHSAQALEEVRFVLFSEAHFRVYADELERRRPANASDPPSDAEQA